MIDVIFHGGAGQVGRSCIEIRTSESRVLLDAGLWITGHGPEFPTNIEHLEEIDAVIISHAHLDHTGALPKLKHDGLKCPIFANIETRKISKILLKDSFKISRIEHDHVGYGKQDIDTVISQFNEVPFGKWKEFKDIKFKLIPSGHIPGSASILIECRGEKLLYTGDINSTETHLLHGADILEEIDYLIIESTYGDRGHPDRYEQEQAFLNSVQSTIERGGSVLIPAFAVGRAQEVLMILNSRGFNVPIYLDGMARQIAELMINFPSLVKDAGSLKNAIDNCHFVRDRDEREEVLRKQCIVISTSGMVNGGPSLHYLGKLQSNKKNSILLTGYQADGTNGRMLVEEGSAFIDGYKVHVKAQIEKYDFSAHSGMEELHNIVLILKPKLTIVQHGDKESIDKFAWWIGEQGLKSVAAELDIKITLHKD